MKVPQRAKSDKILNQTLTTQIKSIKLNLENINTHNLYLL